MKDLLCPVCGGGLPFRFCKVGVRGNVHAKGKIEIKRDGSVIGDLTTAQIIIEDGAYFKGSIEIDRSADKEADNTVSSRTAPTPTKPAAAGAGPRSI